MIEQPETIVSICMITYNHEAYIEKAIQSVLKQKTRYKIELVIGEDSSTDSTRMICENFSTKYATEIKLLPSEKNYGAMQNFIRTYSACSGKYIAILEGDDYWIDNTKLEQQVSFLENNPAYSLCFHDIYNLINGKLKKSFIIDPPETSDLNYLLSHAGYISTLSVVFKNDPYIITFIKQLENCPFGDFITYVAAAQIGLLKYIPTRMGVYRVHSSGVWSTLGLNKAFEKTLLAYKILFNHLPKEQGQILKIKYLVTMEEYFLQTEKIHTLENIEELLIPEMKIEPYVLLHIKNSCEERKKIAYYASKVSFSLLLKSIKYKLLRKIS